MEESILSIIRNEHADIMNHMMLVEASSDVKLKNALYSSLKSKLVEHMEGEEYSIYNRFREDVPNNTAQKLIKASDTEHHQIKEYLQRLNLLDINGKEWPRVFSEFKEFVKKHCQNEEKEMFSEAKEDFSLEELVEIVGDFENNKRSTDINFIF